MLVQASRLGAMLYILRYGENTMGSKSGLKLKIDSGILHMKPKCKGIHINAVRLVIGCLP